MVVFDLHDDDAVYPEPQELAAAVLHSAMWAAVVTPRPPPEMSLTVYPDVPENVTAPPLAGIDQLKPLPPTIVAATSTRFGVSTTRTSSLSSDLNF
jgi:hypothetical protein